MARVPLHGRVVRCERADVWLPGSAVLQNHYEIALTFIDPSPDAQGILDDVCRRSGGEQVALLQFGERRCPTTRNLSVWRISAPDVGSAIM